LGAGTILELQLCREKSNDFEYFKKMPFALLNHAMHKNQIQNERVKL